jgi:hypothetical protein
MPRPFYPTSFDHLNVIFQRIQIINSGIWGRVVWQMLTNALEKADTFLFRIEPNIILLKSPYYKTSGDTDYPHTWISGVPPHERRCCTFRKEKLRPPQSLTFHQIENAFIAYFSMATYVNVLAAMVQLVEPMLRAGRRRLDSRQV